MPIDLAAFSARRRRFFELHEKGCFLLPNPWDAGGARRLEALGFEAIASTSAGAAWAMGKEDGEPTRGEILAHLASLCAATELPVNADFEAGFADSPDGVAESVALAVETGVAGLSIEDRKGKELYPLALATERIAAARRAIDRTGHRVLLVGRSEGHLIGAFPLEETIARLKAYSVAGADCLYAPCLIDLGDIRRVVEAVAPKPVNVLILGDMRVADLAAAGVRRVSTGGGLARASWSAFEEAARVLKDEGKLSPGARR
jgi:2-methylisocitrate lyase-like PEP mutase family enzyme